MCVCVGVLLCACVLSAFVVHVCVCAHWPSHPQASSRVPITDLPSCYLNQVCHRARRLAAHRSQLCLSSRSNVRGRREVGEGGWGGWEEVWRGWSRSYGESERREYREGGKRYGDCEVGSMGRVKEGVCGGGR